MPESKDSVDAAPLGLEPDPWSQLLIEGHPGAMLFSSPGGQADQVNRLRSELLESRHNLARFENLFRMSPVPLMEQDYTLVEEWMVRLRSQGVTDILEYLGEDLEAIRAVAPLIRIVSANPAAIEAVGMPLDQFIGPIDPVIVNEGAEPSWLAQFDAVWNGHPVARASFSASTIDGRIYDAESILAAPLIDGEPDYSRAVFTLLDVSSHRAEERRMEELVMAKSQFVVRVSHEIRTPLTAIVGFADLLEQDEEMPPGERRQMVAAIGQQAREVADLVDDLLVATRVELGKIDVARDPVDLISQITGLLSAGGSYTEGVSADIPAGELTVRGDPARIRQILRNLLTNAERYGGRDVRITVIPGEGEVVVEVSDDGPGLPAADLERSFEAYGRSPAGQELRPESVGIGLSISRELAELMGGSLTYVRSEGRSIFRLLLEAA